MNPETKKKLLILGGVTGLTGVGYFLMKTFLKPKEAGAYDVSEVGFPFIGNAPVDIPETPALPGQDEPTDWEAYFKALASGLPQGSPSGSPSGGGNFVPTSGGYGDLWNPVDPSGKDTITPSALTSPDIGVVKYAVYPGEPWDVNYMDPTTKLIYESGRGVGFKLQTVEGYLRAPFEWLTKLKYKSPFIPDIGVEAQIVASPKKTYPDPSPSVTTPEGWLSTPTHSSLGYMPGALLGSQTAIKTGKMPYTPVRESLTPFKTVQTNAFAKPSWLG